MRPALRRVGIVACAVLALSSPATDSLARRAPSADEALWTRLVAEAERAQAAGDWRALERASHRRVRLETERHGPQSANAAAAWSWVGQALVRQKRDAAAEEALRRAHEAALASLGPNDPQTLLAMTNHAAVLERLGRFETAEPLRRRLLDATRDAYGPRSTQAAAAAAALADLRTAAGRPLDAEPLYRLAVEIGEALYGEHDPRLAHDLMSLAAALDQLGKHAEAEAIHRRALVLCREADGGDGALTARAYALMARNLDAQGRHAMAEPLHRRALERVRALPKPHRGDIAAANLRARLEADATLALGVNLTAQGRTREAAPSLRAAVHARQASFGRASPEAAVAMVRQAEARLAETDSAGAARIARRGLEILRRTRGETHPDTAQAYAALGAALQAGRRPADAAKPLQKALDARRARLGDRHPLTARAYDALAQNQARLGAAAPAEVLAARAIAIVRARDIDPRRGAASLTAGSGDGLDLAGSDAALLRRYLGLAWAAGRRSANDLPRIQDQAFLVAQDLAATPAARAMANASARAGLPPAAARTARVKQDLDRDARRLKDRLRVALPAADPGEPARIGAALDAVSLELDHLDRRIDDRLATSRTASLTVDQLQARLVAGEALLLMVPSGDDVHVFAVSRTRTAWWRAEGARPRLDNHIKSLRCQMDDAACPTSGLQRSGAKSQSAQVSGSTLDLTAAHALYAELIAPVEPALGDARRLFVNLDGALAGLPLGIAALDPPPAAADAPRDLTRVRWLADRYAITVLPSVASFRATPLPARRPSRSWTFAGFGAPDLGTPAAADSMRPAAAPASQLADPRTLHAAYGPLPGAADELRAMARVLGAPLTSIRTGPAATEAALKASRRLAQARVVAIATHGILSNETPGVGEPGLILTPPSSATTLDDGVLTASEASALQLQADWVILSACNTAGPDGSPGGRHLSGLAQAFLHAGARALLVSHWRVYDDATSALTARTVAFQRAQPGLTRAEALQLAMRSVRTGRLPDGSALPGWRPEWAHPAYWGPFVVIAADD